MEMGETGMVELFRTRIVKCLNFCVFDYRSKFRVFFFFLFGPNLFFMAWIHRPIMHKHDTKIQIHDITFNVIGMWNIYIFFFFCQN